MSEEQPLKSKELSKSGQQILKRLSSENPEAIVFNDLDNALIGVTLFQGKTEKNLVAVYSRMEILKTLMFEQGISPDDVIEYFEYKIASLYAGEWTPIIVEDDHDEAWQRGSFDAKEGDREEIS